ncbi:MAG: UbiA family prenyltransferase [Candidatus Methanofastidiosia archaeon]|jgi:4-hydroxybenzoate polyprenyltransferase
MFRKVIALIRTMRPMTWVSVIITIFAGMMISFNGMPPVQDIILISVLLPMFLLGYANSLNMYTDYKIDKISRPYRAIPRGILQKETVLYFSIILVVGAIVVSLIALTPFLSVFVIVGLILATAYSISPTRIKARGPAAPISIALGYVCVPYVGASLIYQPLNYDVLLIAVILTIQTAGASISKDFIDLKGDKTHDMDTVPLIVGLQKARRVVVSGLLVPVVVFTLLALIGMLPVLFITYIVLIPWALYIYYISKTETTYEKAYIHSFFFCTVSIFLSGFAYTGGIP